MFKQRRIIVETIFNHSDLCFDQEKFYCICCYRGELQFAVWSANIPSQLICANDLVIFINMYFLLICISCEPHQNCLFAQLLHI